MSSPTLEQFEFIWPGKRAATERASEPIDMRLRPCKNESINWTAGNWTAGDNLFIEGDNLDALKLLADQLTGQVKMIYIDPPYNTGKDFVYRDNFTKPVHRNQHRNQRSNQRSNQRKNKQLDQSSDGHGQATSSRRHAEWLSMIYPRLLLARQLLRADGLIFVSIDDNEVHNLKQVMNEIYGEENLVAQFVWHSSTAGGIRARYVNRNHEYTLCYAHTLGSVGKLTAPLSAEAIKHYNREDDRGRYREKDFAWVTKSANPNQRYLIECPDGTFVQPRPTYLFRYVRKRFDEALADDMVVFKKTKTSPLVDEHGEQARWNIYIKKYLGDATGAPSSLVPKSVVGISNGGTREIKRLFGSTIFNNVKPTQYLQYFLEIGLGPDDLVLDFFAGSCSTAHAVLNLNQKDGGTRRYIMVQQPEPTPIDSIARNAGYETIAEIGKERIRRVLQEIDPHGELGCRVYKVVPSQAK